MVGSICESRRDFKVHPMMMIWRDDVDDDGSITDCKDCWWRTMGKKEDTCTLVMRTGRLRGWVC